MRELIAVKAFFSLQIRPKCLQLRALEARCHQLGLNVRQLLLRTCNRRRAVTSSLVLINLSFISSERADSRVVCMFKLGSGVSGLQGIIYKVGSICI